MRVTFCVCWTSASPVPHESGWLRHVDLILGRKTIWDVPLLAECVSEWREGSEGFWGAARKSVEGICAPWTIYHSPLLWLTLTGTSNWLFSRPRRLSSIVFQKRVCLQCHGQRQTMVLELVSQKKHDRSGMKTICDLLKAVQRITV